MKNLFSTVILIVSIFCFDIQLFAQSDSSQAPLFDALGRAKELFMSKDYDNSLRVLDSLIQKNPNFTEAYLNRGLYELDLKRKDAAKADFDNMLRVARHKYKVAMNLANIFFQVKEYSNAFIYYDSASNYEKEQAFPYYRMGRCIWLEKLAKLKAANVEDFSTDTELTNKLKPQILDYYRIAIELDSIKNNALYISRPEIEAIKDMHSNYEFYYDRAIFEINFGEFQKVYADLKKSIQIHPTIETYRTTAYIAKKLGDKSNACDYMQKWATMINPSESQTIFEKKEIADKFCKDLNAD